MIFYLIRKWKQLFSTEYTPRYSRLAGDLTIFKYQLEKRIADFQKKHNITDEKELPEWALKARALIAETESYLNQEKIDEGWKSLHTSKRMEIYGMDEHELRAAASALRNQAHGLDDHYKKTILDMIGESSDKDAEIPTSEILAHALRLKDRYYNDLYYQNRLSRNHFKLLFTLLFFSVLGIILYFFLLSRIFGQFDTQNLGVSKLIIGVFLFSLLGAITSAILFTRNISTSSRKSEIGSNEMVSLSKIFVGVAFSFFIFMLIKSSVGEGISIFSFSIDKPLDYFAIAYVSGFSERLAQRAIKTIAGEDEETDKK